MRHLHLTIFLGFSSDVTNVWTSYVWYCILASNMFNWCAVGQIMIGRMGFFLPDNIISLSSNTACERGGKVQVVFDEFKLSRSPPSIMTLMNFVSGLGESVFLQACQLPNCPLCLSWGDLISHKFANYFYVSFAQGEYIDCVEENFKVQIR